MPKDPATQKHVSFGTYGELTKQAVMKFQKKMKLKVDGIVGSDTWNAMQLPWNKETNEPNREHNHYQKLLDDKSIYNDKNKAADDKTHPNEIKKGYENETTKDGNVKKEGKQEIIIDEELVDCLKLLGFDLQGSGDTYRVKLSSALIVAQWYIFKKGSNDFRINGDLNDQKTKKALKSLVGAGIDAVDIINEAKKNWRPEKPTLGTDRYSPDNGHLNTNDMVYIPSLKKRGSDFAIAEKSTAVAWAMMVQGAIEYNHKEHSEKEIKDYGKSLNIANFIVTGPDSGYRSYHMQVEARMDWTRRQKPDNASPLKFKYPNGEDEFKKLYKKLGPAPKVNGVYQSTGWDNIDDSYTNEGGVLYGSGTSNHGLGAALDLNFGMGQYQAIGITNKNGPTYKTRNWVENYGRDYGFEGLYNDKTHYYREWVDEKGVVHNNFKETWHLTYMGPDVAPRKEK